ncbi:MAG: CBS domain-containing protein, partial [Planctomycetota bacterium JB042]
MKTDYTAFPRDFSVRSAIARLKARAGVHHAPSNIYVVDDANKLIGVISMRDLVIAARDAPLGSL